MYEIDKDLQAYLQFWMMYAFSTGNHEAYREKKQLCDRSPRIIEATEKYIVNSSDFNQFLKNYRVPGRVW